MEGAELSARFALPPNSKGYCGLKPLPEIFAAYLKNRNAENLRSLQNALPFSHAHYAYLKLIARVNGRKPFEREVAEALWFGNGLLRKVKKEDLQRMIMTDFVGKGMLDEKKAERLASMLPDGFVAHHSFHTLYIHSVTGVVPPTVKTSDNCRVSCGKVIRVGKNAVEVRTQRLARKDGILKLVPCKKKWRTSCAGIELLKNMRRGDWVASHWGVAVMRISKRQKNGLESATLQNVSAANQK